MLKEIRIKWDKVKHVLYEEHPEEVSSHFICYHACPLCGYTIYDDSKSNGQDERNKLIDLMSKEAALELKVLLLLNKKLEVGSTELRNVIERSKV